ncbi:3-hydroxyacyl-CoA dehydrogenase NAD-binding domain-containing protein [Georgenia sp. TF02-10]|uniref:3-hydroxyacyl-CoA dehydrogenase NAD-binding domain-containing protein n=1 Tax=Georgenia sp. TF02-10 TaxID=2917725 RepID=UPI001FA79A29|nr:3-hydroxyacyl-CoA dehydrogenase NAD-binding domain-containing protein [Georgenia sp. TF02-10]UNX53365.1 3-hydroxyacyl-CoA dehydrogenase NAD-binding domain-containing protein [Georgenia sp. TF02-10]
MSPDPATATYAERTTVVHPSDVVVPDLGDVLVLTLAPEDGSDRPCTLGPAGLANLEAALGTAAERASAGEIGAVVLTGTGRTFLAGADLHLIRTVREREQVLRLATAGHRVVAALADLPVPTLAHLNGAALGGGLELALACDYRTAAPEVRALGLPETYLGLLPGWGGCTSLPRLLGPDAALQVIVDNPARNNRTLTARAALDVGLVDALLPTDDEAGRLAPALDWLRRAAAGEVEVRRRAGTDGPADGAGGAGGGSAEEWQGAVEARQGLAAARSAGGAPAAERALQVVAAARSLPRDEAFALEDEALADLVMTDQLRAGLYAFDLLTRRAKSPAGRPAGATPREIRAVGVAGAGLMAGQLALLLARSLRVPVTMRDLDDERAARGLAAVRGQIDQLVARGHLDEASGAQLRPLLRVTTDLADLAGSDLVIEAVFEELDVKRRVFAELESVVGPEAVLATNTSALSVTAMADGLAHPERVVGLHFFNPVAQMPLVEVVRAERTDDDTYTTAFAVAQACRKTAVAVADAPGFVVNRLLVRLLGEVLGSLEEGTTVADADRALRPMGLPMGPFQLLQLVGPAVAEHVLVTLRRELGERYPDSPGLARMVAEGAPFVTFTGRPTATSPVAPDLAGYFGSRPVPEPLDADGVLDRVRRALAEETALLLGDGVARDAGDVDLAMILGAGWPLHLGGITPYLDRTGAAEAVTGQRFHAPGVASLPA